MGKKDFRAIMPDENTYPDVLDGLIAYSIDLKQWAMLMLTHIESQEKEEDLPILTTEE